MTAADSCEAGETSAITSGTEAEHAGEHRDEQEKNGVVEHGVLRSNFKRPRRAEDDGREEGRARTFWMMQGAQQFAELRRERYMAHRSGR